MTKPKRYLSIFLALAIVLTLGLAVAPPARAEEKAICEIDSTGYSDFAKALEAALNAKEEGVTIKLLQDIDYSVTTSMVIKGKSITFNLNKYKLNVTSISTTGISVQRGGEIKLEGEGELNVTSEYSTGLSVDEGCKATVTNVSGVDYGVKAFGGATAEVTGNISVTASQYNSPHCGVYAAKNSIVKVDGNISLSADNRRDPSTGVWAFYGSVVEVAGSVSVDTNAQKIGAKATRGAEVTISGGINVEENDINWYITLDGKEGTAKAENVKISSKDDHLEYRKEVKGETNTIWIKTPKVDPKPAPHPIVPPTPTPKPEPTQKHIAYIQGDPSGKIRPDDNISRAEAAVIFFRLSEDKDKFASPAPSFDDVTSDTWYYQAVKYLASKDTISGYPDRSFRPNDTISRAEFVSIAARFSGLQKSTVPSFADVGNDFWASGTINAAAAKGWTIGEPDGRFYPDNKITRAQAVTFVNRMLNRKLAMEDIPATAAKFPDIAASHWAYCDIIEAANTHECTRKANDYERWK